MRRHLIELAVGVTVAAAFIAALYACSAWAAHRRCAELLQHRANHGYLIRYYGCEG